MAQDFLSNVELYLFEKRKGELILLEGAEFEHAVKVMHNKIGDEIFVTDGRGKIYKTKIFELGKKFAELKIIETKVYSKEFENVHFVIPLLRKSDRFEFALEKLTELGITEIIVYRAERSVKVKAKLERWRKVVTAATKQSLRAFVPEIKFISSLRELNCSEEDLVLIFEQSAGEKFNGLKNEKLSSEAYLIFGPEGGLTQSEIERFPNARLVKLTENRLRAETAILTAAALLSYSK